MKIPVRTVLTAASVMLAVTACGKKESAEQAQQPGAAAQEEKVLHVFNWSDYIAEDTVPNFEKQSGIKVTYDVFDSNDVLETRLLAGNSGFDLVVPSASFLERQIKAGVFQKLDKSKLTNLGNAWDEIAARLAAYDPGNQYAVNYMWGTTGIGFNVKKAREVLGSEAKIDSWDVLFKPDVIARFKDCGVHVLDAADDVFAAALDYLGLDPNTKEPADLEKAAALLTKVRPFVRKFHSSEYLNALASGEICLVLGYSGDIKQAQKRAAEAKNGIEIGYAIPKENRSGAASVHGPARQDAPPPYAKRRRALRHFQRPQVPRARGADHRGFHP